MKRIFILLLLFLLLFPSCKELYNYEGPGENSIVVDGMITDAPGPYYITLNKVLPFSNNPSSGNDTNYLVQGAIVFIKSDKGENVQLQEYNPGNYKTNGSDIQGEVGHSYYITIQTREGDVYESLPSTICESPVISDIDVNIEKQSFLETNSEGNQVATEVEGMAVSAQMKLNNTSKYFKIDVEGVYQIQRIIERPISICEGCKTACLGCNDIPIYCWSNFSDLLPNIFEVNSSSSVNNLDNVPAIFIQPIDPIYLEKTILPLDLERTPIVSGYIVDIKAYDIDENIYEYYRNVITLFSAQNKIFDPIPVQLTGNIKCINKPEKIAYGIFIATSVNRKQFFIVWNPGTSDILKKEMGTIYNIPQDSACTEYDTLQPVWWQNINGK
jgi:hypothetical protein